MTSPHFVPPPARRNNVVPFPKRHDPKPEPIEVSDAEIRSLLKGIASAFLLLLIGAGVVASINFVFALVKP